MRGVLILALAAMQAPSPGLATLARGAVSDIESPRQVVVRQPAEWKALWVEHAAAQPMPEVDFSTSIVAAVFLGTRPTGGFSVEIVRARQDGADLVLEYVERRPDPGLLVTQVLTMPFHIVRLPRHDGPVRFARVEK